MVRDPLSGQRAVLERMHSELAKDPEIYGRFLDQAHGLQQLHHPNLLTRTDVHCDKQGRLYTLSESIEGQPLSTWIKKNGPLSPQAALSVAIPLCDAVHYLHQRGLRHGNLSPQYVFIDAQHWGQPRLLDTGLTLFRAIRAIPTHTELVRPSYLAPERICGRRGDSLSDIYGLGVLLYEMLTGAPPYEGDSPLETRRLHLRAQLKGLPAQAAFLNPIVRKCLARDRHHRYQDVAALATALRAVDATHAAPLTTSPATFDTAPKATRTSQETQPPRQHRDAEPAGVDDETEIPELYSESESPLLFRDLARPLAPEEAPRPERDAEAARPSGDAVLHDDSEFPELYSGSQSPLSFGELAPTAPRPNWAREEPQPAPEPTILKRDSRDLPELYSGSEPPLSFHDLKAPEPSPQQGPPVLHRVSEAAEQLVGYPKAAEHQRDVKPPHYYRDEVLPVARRDTEPPAAQRAATPPPLSRAVPPPLPRAHANSGTPQASSDKAPVRDATRDLRKPATRGPAKPEVLNELLDSAEMARFDDDEPEAVVGVSLQDRMGEYELLDLLGQGGMGHVYLAKHLKSGQDVAIKVLKPDLATNPRHLRRFVDEARAVGRIKHPNIVQMTDMVKTEDGRIGCVMEPLVGKSLGDVLREGTVTIARALRITSQICSALDAAHELGVIHRDIKPDNIFLTNDAGGDFVKVLDFGVAKLNPEGWGTVSEIEATQTGMLVGTPSYMAPEQASGNQVDARTDLYSVGTVLYRMVAGQAPFTAPTVSLLLAELLMRPPKPLPPESASGEDISTPVRKIIARCLDKAPERRFQNMRALKAAIDAVAAGATDLPHDPFAGPSSIAGKVRALWLYWKRKLRR